MLYNIIIGIAFDNYENDLADETEKASTKFNLKDSSNGINVIVL